MSEAAVTAQAPSASRIIHTPRPFLAYVLTAVALGLAQGFGLNFIAANITQIQGEFGVTTNESAWLLAAYYIPNVSLSIILIKVRNQFGLRNFAEIAILVFLAVSAVHLFVDDFGSALILRFFAGAAGAALSSLGFLYMFEPFAPARKMTVGLSLALANQAVALPLARIISPALLDIGGWHALYLLEVAMALIAFTLVYKVPLGPVPRTMTIRLIDLISYGFLATGLGCLAVALTLGRYYWWLEAPWIGVLLAVAVAGVAMTVVVELNRKEPLLDIAWLTSPPMLHFLGVLLLFRVALSEQASGALALLTQLGLAPYQLTTLWTVILIASVGASAFCTLILKPGREPLIHAVALVMIGTGAWMDASATSLTRPGDILVSQALIAAGGGLFLPPALSAGFINALSKGPNYITGFIMVFIFTQTMGGLFGSALFGTFATIREKVHSVDLVAGLARTDPLIAARVAQLGQSYAGVLTDKALLTAEGGQLLAQQVTREAWVLAYNDLFLAIAAICALALIALIVHSAWRAVFVRPAAAA
jgi:MFS family permease